MKIISIALTLSLLSMHSVRAQSGALRVIVLNGKNGKPLSGITISVSARSGRYLAPLITSGKTDRNGVIAFKSTLPPWIEVEVHGRYLCSRLVGGGTSTEQLAKIMHSGVVEPNLCSRNMNVNPVPGELVLFVRRESLKEFLDMY